MLSLEPSCSRMLLQESSFSYDLAARARAGVHLLRELPQITFVHPTVVEFLSSEDLRQRVSSRSNLPAAPIQLTIPSNRLVTLRMILLEGKEGGQSEVEDQ